MAKELIEPMEFFKIDKLSDEVFVLSPNISLRFNVSLSKTTQNGNRYHFHKEFEYPSRSNDVPSLVTIKRSFDYYFSIESSQKDGNGNKVFIRIGTTEYYLLKRGLDEVYKWFNDSKYSKLFARNKGELVLMPPIPNYVITGLPMNKYIELKPAIIDRGYANADKEPGIRMYLSSDIDFIDLPLERFMGLYYIINSFNMYQSAIELINYLQRPDFGTNRYVIGVGNAKEAADNYTKPRYGSSGIEGRFVTPKDSKPDITMLEGE